MEGELPLAKPTALLPVHELGKLGTNQHSRRQKQNKMTLMVVVVIIIIR